MRYRSLALIAVVALVASSCSADPGGGSPATPAGEDPSAGSAVAGGLSVDQQELTDAMRLLMLRDEQLSAEFTDDQIGCLSEGLAGAFSDVRRDELQLDADSLTTSHNDRASFALGVAYEMTDDETLDVVAGASKCVDWRPAAAEDLVDAGVPPTEAECIASELPDPGIESMVMRTLVIGSTEPAPGFGLTDDESFEATGPCLDVEGTFVDLLVGEAGISEHGARCLADGLPDWVFETELDVDEDAEEPSIEDLTELEARCLSPGELQSLSAASLDDTASSAIPLEPPSPTELEVVVQEIVGPSGGGVAQGGVVISVPSGALSELAEVRIREPLGEFGSEVGGVVVEVEHLNPVQMPITVTWDVSHLSDTEQRGILLVHWDDDLEDWVPEDVDYEIRDGVLTAAFQEWGFRSWAKEQGKKLVSVVVSGGKKLVSGGKALASNINKAGAKAWNRLKKGPAWAKKTAKEAWNSTKAKVNTAWVYSTDKAAQLSQILLEVIGRRVAAPKCSEDPLPDWVEDPYDTILSSAAILVCYENGGGSTLRMRMSNNRNYSQFVYTTGSDGWSEYGLGGFEPSLQWVLEGVAHRQFSSHQRIFIPPLTESYVEFERPSDVWVSFNNDTGSMDAGEAVVTMLVDIVTILLGLFDMEIKDERVEIFFELLLECGVQQLYDLGVSVQMDNRGKSAQAFMDIVVGCGGQVLDSKSAMGEQFRERLSNQFGEESVKTILDSRKMKSLGNFFKLFATLGEIVIYIGEVLIEQLVGTLYWGVSFQGQPFSGLSSSRLSDAVIVSPYISIAAGGGHACGIRVGGTVECWGDNAYGQADAPSARFSVISADWDHSCGIRSDGTVECWGNNASGQTDPPSGRFVAISDGGYHSCGLREDSSVECWGSSAFGRVDAPSGRFAAVSAGGDHSCGIRHGGAVECWGYDGLGQIDAPANQFMEVSSGWSHSCGIRSNGTVECWGDNSVGRTDAPSGQFTAISAGSEHSCGIRSNGTVECWGDNSFGRTDAPSGQFTAISAGLDQSCGIRDDGAVECWGYDGDR